MDRFDLDMAGVLRGTNKSSSFHVSMDFLQRLFQSFRHEPINLIEIGEADGASLKTWTDYFARAQIVGVDIREQCTRFAGGRIGIEIGSQGDPDFLRRVCEKYPPSIIIDDGLASGRSYHVHVQDHVSGAAAGRSPTRGPHPATRADVVLQLERAVPFPLCSSAAVDERCRQRVSSEPAQ
jgi:hypothetical protein